MFIESVAGVYGWVDVIFIFLCVLFLIHAGVDENSLIYFVWSTCVLVNG